MRRFIVYHGYGKQPHEQGYKDEGVVWSDGQITICSLTPGYQHGMYTYADLDEMRLELASPLKIDWIDDEPTYTANQPIWYDTGVGKLQAEFLKYVGMRVEIRTGMHPQIVYISQISPRVEGGQG